MILAGFHVESLKVSTLIACFIVILVISDFLQLKSVPFSILEVFKRKYYLLINAFSTDLNSPRLNKIYQNDILKINE